MRNFLALQTIILAGGTLYTWSKLVVQIDNFLMSYGSLLRFQNCIIPNPLVTACFYGSIAMLVAFVWSARITYRYNEQSQKWLRYLLYFGTVFATAVLGFEFLQFYDRLSVEINAIGCTPGVHPLRTPCFIGLLFFLTASINATVLHYKFKTNRLDSDQA